jgi:hypothetical protein
MTRAVELHAEGLSLRKIAARLNVTHQTVANDLARWDRERANVTPMTVKNDRLKVPPNLTPECDGVTCDGVWSARVGGTLLECRVHKTPDPHHAARPIADVVPIRRTS